MKWSYKEKVYPQRKRLIIFPRKCTKCQTIFFLEMGMTVGKHKDVFQCPNGCKNNYDNNGHMISML